MALVVYRSVSSCKASPDLPRVASSSPPYKAVSLWTITAWWCLIKIVAVACIYRRVISYRLKTVDLPFSEEVSSICYFINGLVPSNLLPLPIPALSSALQGMQKPCRGVQRSYTCRTLWACGTQVKSIWIWLQIPWRNIVPLGNVVIAARVIWVAVDLQNNAILHLRPYTASSLAHQTQRVHIGCSRCWIWWVNRRALRALWILYLR